MLRGNLDIVTLHSVAGWAQDDAEPDVPVSLLVIDNDQLLGRILANRHRPDLEAAGIGNGRHSFELDFPKALSPFEQHVIRVCREIDGADLAQSPVTLEPPLSFDDTARNALADILKRCGADTDIPAKIDFLVGQIDVLLQQRADGDSHRFERQRYRHYLQRWRRRPQDDAAAGRSAMSEPPSQSQRALVIDDRVPVLDRDAGSIAVLSHIRSLQRLGFEVAFAPATEFAASAKPPASLQAINVTCYGAPYYGSIEEVLRRQAGEFDVVYMHRVANAMKYGELVRVHMPKAWRIYSVADLHHIRLARQAEAEDRPEFVAQSQRMRFAEYVAAITANSVITHSSLEAEVLRKQVPATKVHVVPWTVAAKPTTVPFAQRQGIAFIGGYDHEPNLDAARWLISEIMPLVRQRKPEIVCSLIGSAMPDELRRMCGNGVVPEGHVDDLAAVFDRVRLTVAPLTFGAGIKGKVIESLGAGVPCVCTPIAAEGLDLPAALRACVADGAEGLAALICDLHENQHRNDECGRAGVSFVAANFSDAVLDVAMRRALGPAVPVRREVIEAAGG